MVIQGFQPPHFIHQRLRECCRRLGKLPLARSLCRAIPWLARLRERIHQPEQFASQAFACFNRLDTHGTSEEEIANLEEALSYYHKALARGYETPEMLFQMLKCLYFLGRNAEQEIILARYFACKRRDAGFVRFEKQDRILMPVDRTRSLGCLGYLATYSMMEELTGRRRKIVVSVYEEEIANKSFLSYFMPFIELVTDPAQIEALQETRRLYETPIDWGLEYKGRAKNVHRITADVVNDWYGQGRGPLLALREEHRKQGEAVLREIGVPQGAWFVCMHARTSGYHKDVRQKESFRNTDIETFRKAAAEIVARGGRVFRMGDASMPAFEAEGVFDYARSAVKSDWMDVFLLAQCRFFLGTSSGPHKIPFSFGVPCVQTNAVPVGCMPFSPDDIVLPKRIRDKRSGRVLSFREIMREPYSYASVQYNYDALGMEAIENTEEEIYDAVVSMMESFEGGGRLVPPLTALQEQWNSLARKQDLSVSGRIDNRFLERHRALMEEQV